MDFKELYTRYDEAKNEKGRWLAEYQRLYSYVIPNRDAFNVRFNYNDSGKPTTNQIWDDTAQLAATSRANELQSLLMPKDRNWGKFALDPHLFDEQEIEQARPIIDEINQRIMFYINQSNLSRVTFGSNLDLTGGTGVIMVESWSDEVPLVFRSIPSVSTYIEQTNDDMIDNCWYDIKINGYKFLSTFPNYKGKCHSIIKDNPAEVYTVSYGQLYDTQTHKYFIYAFLPDLDPYAPIFETERAYRQIIIYRDKVRPGESEGRGIGLDLLQTIEDLNIMVRDDRKNKALKANPPMFYDTPFNPWSMRRWSGAMIARNPGGRNPIEPLQMPTYPDVMQHEEVLRNIIRKGFEVDPLGDINSPVKTATEISIRENRAQRASATNMARLINEQPKQIYETCAKILAERNLITKDRSIGGINTERFRFDFQSPLFDIQKQEDLNRFAQNLQMKQQFFGQGAAMATVNVPKANEFLTENFNLPHKLFKSESEIIQIMQAANAQAAQAQQAQMMQGMPQPTTTAEQPGMPQQTPELM